MADFSKLVGGPGQTPVDAFEAVQQERKKQAALRASTVLSQRPTFNPTQRASDVNLSFSLKQEANVDIPPQMVGDQNRPQLEFKLDDVRIKRLVEENERAANYLSNPINAEIAYDDLNTIGVWGGLGNATARGADAVYDNLRLKPKLALLGTLDRALRADGENSFADLYASEAATSDADPNNPASVDLNQGPISGALENAAGAVGRYVTSRIAGMVGGDSIRQMREDTLREIGTEADKRNEDFGGNLAFDDVNRRMAALPEAAGPVEGLLNVFKVAKEDPLAFINWSTQVAAESIPGIVAATATTLATRNPRAGAAVLGAGSAVRAEEGNFRELAQAAGYDLTDRDSVRALLQDPAILDRIGDQAFTYGLVVGVVDGLSGGLASAQLVNNPAGDFMLQMMVQAAAGSGGEALGRLASGQKIDWTEVVTEGIVEMVTGPLEIVGVGGRATVRRAQQAVAAQERKKVFAAMADTTGTSKLKGRSEAKYGEMVAEITKDGPIENMYVDPEQMETLFQSQGISAEEFFSALPELDQKMYQHAKDTGSDFKIPTSVYASKIIGSKFEQTLQEHLKFGPLEMSVAEANNLQKDIEKSIADIGTTLERVEREVSGMSDEGRREFENLTGQLRQTGRTPEVAAREALPLIRFAETQAQRAGVTAGEYLRRYALPVISGSYEPQTMSGMRIVDNVTGLPEAVLARLPGSVESASAEDVSEATIAAVEAGEITEEQLNALGVITSVEPGGQTLNQPGSPAFDAWFGDSKVVNEDGSPKRMFHGTPSTFDEFKGAVARKGTKRPDQLGVFFTDSSEYAAKYAASMRLNAEGAYEPYSGTIMPVYLAAKRPWEGDWDALMSIVWRKGLKDNPSGEQNWSKVREQGGFDMEAVREYFHQSGFDSIVLRDWSGDSGLSGVPDTQEVWIVLDPVQIKSAFNRGTFDPQDPRILNQAPLDAASTAGPVSEDTGRLPNQSEAKTAAEAGFENSEVQSPVYHWTSAEFDEFRVGDDTSGRAIWFTPDPDYEANMHNRGVDSRAIKAFVNLENPLMLDEFNLQEMQQRWAGGSKEFPFYVTDETRQRLLDADFDGVIADDVYGDASVDEVIVFDPTQIKIVDPAAIRRNGSRTLNQEPVDGRLPGLEKASPGPVEGVREIASQYMRDAGLPVRHQAEYAKVDVERATEIARLYEEMEHAPDDPEVRAAYEALAEETLAQYDALLELGYTFEFIDFEKTGDPYDTPRDAIVDMQENKHLWVFPTDAGFGSGVGETKIGRDNPGGRWLEEKVARAERDMAEAPGTSYRSKGLGGSVTAYTKEAVMLPLSEVRNLRGAQNERRAAGDPKFDALAADVAERGFQQGQDGNAIVVGVNHLGEAYLLEGNTRVAVAAQNDVQSIRADVRWFNGAETADGAFSPAKVKEMTAPSNDHPLLAKTGIMIDGREAVVNDIFRIVHDVFGHGSEGASFGPRGEENAWQAHVRMFSPLAARAMTSETRGQNSWVNYGPHGEKNRQNPHDTVFADQKTGLLPEWVSTIGQAEDQIAPNTIVGPDEKPVRLYHGTTKLFDRFNDGRIFLTSRRGLAVEHATRGGQSGARLIEANVQLENPLEVGPVDDDPDTYWLRNALRLEEQMAAGGHDAIMIWNEGGELLVIATRNDQITQIGPDTGNGQTQYYGMPLREDGKLVLTHWSSAKRDKIDPAFAGTGPIRINNPGPKQAFFGVNVRQPGGYRPEGGLGDVRHTVAVDPKRLYPFYEDPLGLKDKLDMSQTGLQQVGAHLKNIKEAGYTGALFTSGPLGAVAVTFEAVPVESAVDESRVLFQSAVDLLRDPIRIEKLTLERLGAELSALHMAKYGRKLDPAQSEEDYQDVLSRVAGELEDQLNEPNSGVGWYSKDTADALAMASIVYPTLATNQAHRDLLVTFMGIFSNGLTPEQAFMLSGEAFDLFLETGEPPVNRGGGMKWSVRENNVVGQLKFVKHLTDTFGSLDAAMDWLKREQPRSDIDEMMRSSGYHQKGRFVTKKALAGPPARGMLVFGEKLGRYTMGLHGFDISAEDVTIDVWYTRTYRRLIGGLMEGPLGPEGIVAGPTNSDREVIRRMTGDLENGFGLAAQDVQAALWFFEKRLYDAQGIQNVAFGTNSEGARRLLFKKGVVNDQELAEQERQRLDGTGGSAAYGGVGLATAEEMDAFYQRTPKGPRGQIMLPPSGSQTAPLITLFNSADLSTVLHESGHYYLHTLERMRNDGVEHAQEEWAALTSWWERNAAEIAGEAGITEKQFLRFLQTGNAGSPELNQKANVGIQEYFARGMEAYLLEGKAPSNALRAAFESFMAWLLAVYRDAKNLRVNLDDEVRGVFDRLLATDAEIAEARAASGGMADAIAETARTMGVDPETYQRLVDLTREARDEARQLTLRDIMAPIRAMREEENRQERKRLTAQITDEVMAKRHNRVIQWLGYGRWVGGEVPREVAEVELRLDPALLAEEHGEGVEGRLPRGSRPLTLKGSGVSADDIAGLFGYRTGADLVQDILRAPKAADEIKQRVDVAMQERVKDPLDEPGGIEQIAVDALHGDKSGQLIVAELRAINRLASRKQPMTSRAQARAIAREMVARMQVREAVASHRYLAAERKFAEQAGRDLAAGKIEEAFEAKRKQLINHALYAESREVAATVAKTERLTGRLRKRSTRKNLAGEYLDAIDEILDRYDFRKLSGNAERRRGSLLAYVEMMKRTNRENELAIPDKVLNDARRRPYKTLPVRELEGVYDSLRNIEHTARMKQKLRDAKEARELDVVVEELLGEFEENIGAGRPPKRVETKFGKIRDAGVEFVKLVENTDTILRRISGWKNGGAASRHLKAAIDDAEIAALTMREKAAIDMDDLYDVYSRTERVQMARPRVWSGFDEALSKWDVISIALNTGNKDNFERLTSLDTRGAFTAEQVEALLENLDARDWKFVQSVWDYIDSYWGEIAARERRTTGVAPKKVDAAMMVNAPDGVNGGYYPIKYSPRFSATVAEEQEQDMFTNMQRGRFGKAQTRNGHTKERAAGGGGRTLDLGMQVFHGHIAQVIHDLAFSEAVNNTWKVLQDPRVKGAFETRGMLADHRSLEVWLQDVASGRIMTAGILGRAARHMKAGFTISKLAFRLSIIALQVTGLPQSAAVVGKKNMAKALGQYAGGGFYPIAAKVKARSAFMRERETTFQRDIYDLLDQTTAGPIAGQASQVAQFWMRAGFWAMQKVQFYVVDTPTWMAGYEQGLAQGMSDEDAGKHADRMVARAQSSGLFADRSAIERGTLGSAARQNDFIRLFTTLGSYMFAKYNVATETVGRARRDVTGMNAQSVGVVLNATLDMMMLFTLEAILYAAIKGRLPDDDEDEDDTWTRFLARETALSAMGTLPFVRDLASAAQGYSGGGAYGGVMETIARGMTSFGALFGDEELTESDLKAAIDAAGLALPGIPSSFIKTVVEAEIDRVGGEDVSPLDYLMGR